MGIINTKVVQTILNILAPTLDYKPGNLNNVPVIVLKKEKVETSTKENYKISVDDWNCYENAWNFRKHPLLPQALEGKKFG